MTTSSARTALIQARILEDQQWAYDRRIRDALHWDTIRALALRPRSAGGLDRTVTRSELKALVAEHRAAEGVAFGTREERIERRSLEYDELALLARSTITGEALMPDLSGLEDEPDDDTRTKIAKAKARAMIQAQALAMAARLRGDAAKLLLDTRAAEAKMHGDDAAQRVDVEVTNRSLLDAEIDAALDRMEALDSTTEGTS